MGSRNRTNDAHWSRIPKVTMPRSSFDLSRGLKLTASEGHLTPFFLQEILPGDTFTVKPHFLARIATPLKPFMDNLYMDYQFFFVPNRLVWDNWEKFNGAQDNPGDSTDFLTPKLYLTGDTGFTLGVGNNPMDYFGLPTGSLILNNTVQAIPFRMLNLIWNEWYRDQNYADSLDVPKGDGPDDISLYADISQYIRFKRHDYFTSLLPQPQKGPTVQIPLGGYTTLNGVLGSQSITRKPNATAWQVYNAGGNVASTPGGDIIVGSGSRLSNSTTDASLDPVGNLEVNVPSTSGIQVPLFNRIGDTIGTIPNLTTAFLIQNYLERNNRGGTRYIEYLKAQFGVTNPDFRLQRPELLSTGSMQININPVMQTSTSTLGETPQGNLAAYGIGIGSGNANFHHSFTEHGYVIGLLSFRAPYTYQNRLDKSWTRNTRSDFYVPALANLTEQPVLRQEMQFIDGSMPALNNYVLGYAERWGEYKYGLNQLSGFMKMQPPASPIASLSYWHLAQYFGTDPQFINEEFLRENPPISRVVAIDDEPHFIIDAHFEVKAARVMPTYNLPATLARF